MKLIIICTYIYIVAINWHFLSFMFSLIILAQLTSTHSILLSFFTTRSVLRQVHSLFQTEFYRVKSSLISLRSSSRCLRLLPPLFPSVTCFRRQLLRKVWPIQIVFFRFTVCRTFLSPWLYAIFHFSHYRSSWSPSFSSTTLQNFQGIPYLFS
jgi:hypothetical protein